ncbi:MAG: single-stranded DNA-binding protein [Cyanobacteria bacterium P01_D01_bin.56]
MKTFSTNRIILTGFVGEKVEHKKVGDPVVSVATFFLGIPYEENEQPTKWETHAIETWRGLADRCKEKLTKGSKVLVEGALRQDRWADGQGNPQFKTYIRADRVEFLHLKQ